MKKDLKKFGIEERGWFWLAQDRARRDREAAIRLGLDRVTRRMCMYVCACVCVCVWCVCVCMYVCMCVCVCVCDFS